MKRKQRREKLVAEINITPFTDVILVLLVIFMITTPLISQTNINVDLPKAKSAKPLEGASQTQIEITITREGPVYLDGKLVTRRELRAQIEESHKNNPDLSVVVRSDKAVKLQDIVDVIDPLAALGITKVNIAARAEE